MKARGRTGKSQASADLSNRNEKIEARGGGLIVRVKRRRSQEPTDSLCIVEEDPDSLSNAHDMKRQNSDKSLSQQMSSLSTQAEQNVDETKALGGLGYAEAGAAGGSGSGSGSAGTVMRRKKVVLRRVSTVGSTVDPVTGQDSAIASSSIVPIKRKRRGSSLGQSPPEEQVKSEKVNGNQQWTTRSKKFIRSGADGSGPSYVVVDLAQQIVVPFSGTVLAEAPSSPIVGKTVILDPPTRQLDGVLQKAFSSSEGANGALAQVSPKASATLLNDILTCLLRGANVNHQCQRAPGGQTSLMLAAICSNARIGGRLLARGADIYLKDGFGRTARNYVDASTAPQSMKTEFCSLIDRQALKARPKVKSGGQENLFEKMKSASAMLKASGGGGGEFFNTKKKNAYNADMNEEDDEEYVFDIFCVDPEDYINNNNSTMGTSNKNGESSFPDDIDIEPSAPIICVDGLKLGSSNGLATAELMFAYDSDWSDLGDDEDPDSNDERYAGNDYPDEEESDYSDYDGNGNGNGSSDDDDNNQKDKGFRHHPTGPINAADMRNNPNNPNVEEDENEDETEISDASEHSDMERARGIGRADIEDEYGDYDPTTSRVDENGEDLMSDEDGDDEGMSGQGKGWNKTQHNTGQVQRPVYAHSQGRHTSESLRALWDVRGNEDDDDDEDNAPAKTYRDHCRALRGPGAVPTASEFDRQTGLPRFGRDLSDDEADERVLINNMYTDSFGIVHNSIPSHLNNNNSSNSNNNNNNTGSKANMMMGGSKPSVFHNPNGGVAERSYRIGQTKQVGQIEATDFGSGAGVPPGYNTLQEPFGGLDKNVVAYDSNDLSTSD